MTADRDTVRALRSLFDEDVSILPDRIFDAVLADLPVTRQERPWLGRPFRSGRIGYAIVVAVAVIAFAVGFAVYGNLGGVGAPVSPVAPASPSPSASNPSASPSPSPRPGTATPPANWPSPVILAPASPLPSPAGSALPADLIGREYDSDPPSTQGIQAEILTLRAADDPHCMALYGGSSTCFTILWTPNYPKHVSDPAVRGPARIVGGNLVLGFALVPNDPACERTTSTYSISADGWTLNPLIVPDCSYRRFVRH
jgi:hypothetical protein